MNDKAPRIPPLAPEDFTSEQAELVGDWTHLVFSRVIVRHPELYAIFVPYIERVIAGSILVFIPSLGAYVTPRVLGGDESAMIASLIGYQFSQAENWPLGAALAILLLAAVAIVLVIFIRTLCAERADDR